MKNAKKSSTIEPTLKGVANAIQDLTEAVQTGFARTEQILDRHEEILNKHGKILSQHGKILGQHGEMLGQHGRILGTLHAGQELLNQRVGDVERRLGKTQNRIEDIADMLEGNYEPRLRHLEKVRA